MLVTEMTGTHFEQLADCLDIGFLVGVQQMQQHSAQALAQGPNSSSLKFFTSYLHTISWINISLILL